MSKIKPYHEPLEANAYVAEVGNSTKFSLEESENGTSKGSFQNNIHHNGESSYSKKPCKLYEGQKVVRKYVPYKQTKTSLVQQKWIGPYTITKIHDDDTIEIKNIYQMGLGRWRSTKFLPYNWFNPKQVITFSQEETKTFSSPDYDEVHHKMLECYSIQVLPKEVLDEESHKTEQTTKMESINTHLSSKGDYYEKNVHHMNFHTNTLYGYNTTTTTKDNTHVKYKVTKQLLYQIMANNLTTRSLQHTFKTWGLLNQYWSSQQWISSLYSSNDIHTGGGLG